MAHRVAFLVVLALAAATPLIWRAPPPGVAIALAVQGPVVETVRASGSVEPVRWAETGPGFQSPAPQLTIEGSNQTRQGDAPARLHDRRGPARRIEADMRAPFTGQDFASVHELAAREIAARPSEATQRRNAGAGEVVDTSVAMVPLGAPRPLCVTAELSEEDRARVRQGQRALLHASTFPDRVFEATVEQITPKDDPARRTYGVRLALPDDTPLRIGMKVEADIVLREDPAAVLVPASAMRDGHVLVVVKEMLEVRPVQLGARGTTTVEIRSGLEAGEAVVLNPSHSLHQGQAIRLRL